MECDEFNGFSSGYHANTLNLGFADLDFRANSVDVVIIAKMIPNLRYCRECSQRCNEGNDQGNANHRPWAPVLLLKVNRFRIHLRFPSRPLRCLSTALLVCI